MARFKIVHGDCEKVLVNCKRRFDLIFADPPFNIDHPYVGFKDHKEQHEFESWTYRWVGMCWDLLSPKGVLCLHGPDHLIDSYLFTARCRGFKLNRIAWVNWHYRFGQCHRANWIDSRCHCLIYAKDPNNYTWRPDDVLVPSDRASVYNDKRIGEYERGGSRLPFTVWGVDGDGPGWGRIQGNNRERRRGHPNQLPEVYLARLIKAYTDPGDYVLDPFGGSGTTVTVAVALGRNCMTCDISEESARSIRERVKKGPVRDL